MSNEPRTIKEAGVGAKVVTIGGECVTVIDRVGDGWFKCRTAEGLWRELHGSCSLKKVNHV